MLIGVPGTRKSTAINIAEKLLRKAGYTSFAAKKTRQEKFLIDLADQGKRLAHTENAAVGGDVDSILDQNLWGDTDPAVDSETIEYYYDKPIVPLLIAADEFNIFIGEHNTDFISLLGDFWDMDRIFDYRLKNSDSVFIPFPTISILGGDTATGFADAFPPKILTQGFFARLLLIYGEPTDKKIFPIPKPNLVLRKQLIEQLHIIQKAVVGEITESPEATTFFKYIYDTWQPMEDLRFESYAGRRLTHLIKLSMVLVASRVATRIEVQDIIYANTILTFTERLMPKALGDFGAAKNSAVTHKVMMAIDKAAMDAKPITTQKLWSTVVSDLENRNQLIEILINLEFAFKIQSVEKGWLPNKKVVDEGLEDTIDWTLLSEAERRLI